MNFEFELADGTPLSVRPIRADDKQLLARGFAELSPESRYRRFFRTIDHLSERQLKYLTEVDGKTHVAFLCVIRDRPDRGVGVARWVRTKEDQRVAEGAVTVIDRYHGRGIGKTLLHVLARAAIEQGVTGFRAWVIGDNAPMLRILTDLGARIDHWEQGTTEVVIPLPPTVEELEKSPAPYVLREVASGRVEATLEPGHPHATRLRSIDA